MKENKKIIRRKFKKIIISTGLLVGLGVQLFAGNNYNDKNTQDAIVTNVNVDDTTTEIIDNSQEIITEQLKEDVADKIISEYNKLGNNLVKQDLGCILQSNEGVSYLFTDQNGNYIFDITQNIDGLNRVNDNYNIIVFIDKQKENKPIASVGKINDQEIKVNVKSVDVNGSRSIQDPNNYLNNENINYDEALDYLHKREAIIK